LVLDLFYALVRRLRIDPADRPHRRVKVIFEILARAVVSLWDFAGDDSDGVTADLTASYCHGDILPR
jgi:hypothetical protein